MTIALWGMGATIVVLLVVLQQMWGALADVELDRRQTVRYLEMTFVLLPYDKRPCQIAKGHAVPNWPEPPKEVLTVPRTIRRFPEKCACGQSSCAQEKADDAYATELKAKAEQLIGG